MSRLFFVKEGVAVWSSHLDLMRALMRSFRRAGIDLKHSQGFTPHPELSILMPLSVGVESQCEIAEFTLAEGCDVPASEIAARMNPVLPAGIRALESYDGGQKAGKLTWLRARLVLEYEGSGVCASGCRDGSQPSAAPCSVAAMGDGGERILRFAQNDRVEALRKLFAQPSLIVEKHSKKGDVETDIAPMIRECSVGTAETSPACRGGGPASRPVEGCCPQPAPAGGMQNEGSGIRDQGSGTVGGGAFDAPPTSEQASAAPCSVAASGDGGERILRFAQNDRGETVVIEAVVAAQNPTLNPLLLVTAIEKYLPEHKPEHVVCRRLEIYDADMNPFR